MNRSELSTLVREAVMIRHIDHQQGNLEAQAERMAMYFPSNAKLGDDTLSQLSFRVDASAFEGMTDEEVKNFIAAQLPEHKWGDIICTPVNGLLSVMMTEAKAYISALVRKRAAILVYGNIKKKQFMLGVELDARKVLPFMDEDEFVQLVISQFPHHDWYDTNCHQNNGLITVTLSSCATKGKSPHALGAKSVSLIKEIYMVAAPVYITGNSDPIEVMEVIMKDLVTSLEADFITVSIDLNLVNLFGKGSVFRFIDEHFPDYATIHYTNGKGNRIFHVMLRNNCLAALTD